MRKGFFGSIAALLASTGMAMADGPVAAPATGSAGGSCAAPVVAAPAYDDHGQGDSTRFWATGEYLLWWFKNSPEPTPLISTGPLGTPGTTVLLGGSEITTDEHSGGRFTVGGWLDCDHRLGVEVEGFFIGEKTVNEAVSSGTGATAITIGVPFINLTTGAPGFLPLNTPGVSTASANERLLQRLYGYGFNGLLGIGDNCGEGLHLSLLGGFRYAELDEDLGFSTLTTGDVGGPLAGFSIATTDQFNTQNRFYGGNSGIRAEWCSGRLWVAATGQIALGWTREAVSIGGVTTTTVGGVTTTTGGTGIFVGPTNAGRFTHDKFAVLPEGTINAGVNVTDWATVFVGYNFFYLSDVVRPGQSIDTGFNGTTRPAPILHNTDFWAQGLNFGVALRF